MTQIGPGAAVPGKEVNNDRDRLAFKIPNSKLDSHDRRPGDITSALLYTSGCGGRIRMASPVMQ